MNPFACRVVLRPRGPLESLDLTVRFVRANGGVWLRLTAALVLPLLPLAVAACVLLEGHPGLAGAPLLLAPLLQAPATALAGRQLFADGVRARDALLACAGRPGAVAWVGLTWWGVATVGLGVAAWMVAVPFTWSTEAGLLEEVPVSRIWRRSWRLATQNLGATLAAVLGWYLLTAWGALAGEAVGQAVVRDVLQLGEPFGSVAGTRVATPYLLGGMLAVQPLYGAYRLMLYLDLRTRAEFWDLQVALRAVGLAATQEPA